MGQHSATDDSPLRGGSSGLGSVRFDAEAPALRAFPEEIFVLTPGMSGADGVSRLSKLVSKAVERHTRLKVFALADSSRANGAGRKLVYSARVLGSATRSRRPVLLCLHLHLAPLALPFALGGCDLVVFLLGVEAWKPLGWLQKQALSRARRLVAISSHTARRFSEKHPDLACRGVQVCHLGVPDVETKISPAPEESFALIVGRMDERERYKGHDVLLDVWPELLKDVPSARLVVVGGGNDRERLEARSRKLGLGRHVSFLGRVPEEKLLELYARSSFFVMPSIHEGFGFVFVEAMRAGKPCVGAPGSASEIIEHGVTGFVVDAGDRRGLSETLRRLFTDGDLRERMGRAGRARFLERFTFERFSDRLLSILG